MCVFVCMFVCFVHLLTVRNVLVSFCCSLFGVSSAYYLFLTLTRVHLIKLKNFKLTYISPSVVAGTISSNPVRSRARLWNPFQNIPLCYLSRALALAFFSFSKFLLRLLLLRLHTTFSEAYFFSFSQYNVVLCFFFCFAAFSTHTFCLYRKRIEIKFIVNIVNNFPYKYFFLVCSQEEFVSLYFSLYLNPSVLLR